MNQRNDVLPDAIHSQIEVLAEKGDEYLSNEEFDGAIESYQSALNLVPDPVESWQASTWLYTAIGESYLLKGNLSEAHEYFKAAMHCPGAIGNPLMHFRLGQVKFDLGYEERALDELVRAYMGAGSKIFEGEDRKYFEFLSSNVDLNCENG